MPFTTIAIEPPHGATYQIGDSLLLAQRGPELRPFGNAVLPTGLARISDTVSGRYIAIVEAVYAPIRPGQVALPAEKFTSAGSARAVPVSDGVRGKFLGGPKRQELKAPQMIVFIDKGRADGVAPGDISKSGARPSAWRAVSSASTSCSRRCRSCTCVSIRPPAATSTSSSPTSRRVWKCARSRSCRPDLGSHGLAPRRAIPGAGRFYRFLPRCTHLYCGAVTDVPIAQRLENSMARRPK